MRDRQVQEGGLAKRKRQRRHTYTALPLPCVLERLVARLSASPRERSKAVAAQTRELIGCTTLKEQIGCIRGIAKALASATDQKHSSSKDAAISNEERRAVFDVLLTCLCSLERGSNGWALMRPLSAALTSCKCPEFALDRMATRLRRLESARTDQAIRELDALLETSEARSALDMARVMAAVESLGGHLDRLKSPKNPEQESLLGLALDLSSRLLRTAKEMKGESRFSDGESKRVEAMARGLANLLVNTTGPRREHRTRAGLSLTSIIQMILPGDCLPWLFDRLLVANDEKVGEGSEYQPHLFGEKKEKRTAQLFEWIGDLKAGMPSTSRISLIRAVLQHLPLDLLTRKYKRSAADDFEGGRTLIESLYAPIAKICHASEPRVCLSAIEALRIWILKAGAAVASTPLLSKSLRSILEGMEATVLANTWENPSSAVIRSTKGIYASMFDLLRSLPQEAGRHPSSASSVLLSLASQSGGSTSKGVYWQAMALAERLAEGQPGTDTFSILKGDPKPFHKVLRWLLLAANVIHVWGTAAQATRKLLGVAHTVLAGEGFMEKKARKSRRKRARKRVKKNKQDGERPGRGDSKHDGRQQNPQNAKKNLPKEEGAIDMEAENSGLSGPGKEKWFSMWLPVLGEVLLKDQFSAEAKERIARDIVKYLVEHIEPGSLDRLLQMLRFPVVSRQVAIHTTEEGGHSGNKDAKVPENTSKRRRLEEGDDMSTFANDEARVLLLCVGRETGIISSADLGDLVGEQVVMRSLQHCDSRLRMRALQLLCTFLKGSEPFADIELKCIQRAIPCLLKAPNSPDSHHFVHHVTRFLNRAILIASSSTVSRQNRGKQMDRGGEGEHKISPQGAAREWILWFEAFLASNLYPGAPFERQGPTLELYKGIIIGWKKHCAPTRDSSSQTDHQNLGDALLSRFVSKSRLAALITCMSSPWERAQRIAYDAIMALPQPSVHASFARIDEGAVGGGIITPEVLTAHGWRLAVGLKSRDAEGASLLWRFVFNSFVRNPPLQRISFQRISGGNAAVYDNQVSENWMDSTLLWLEGVLKTLKARIEGMKKVPLTERYEVGPSAPAAGITALILITRYTLKDVDFIKWWTELAHKCKSHQRGNMMARLRTWAIGLMGALVDLGKAALSLHKAKVVCGGAAAIPDEDGDEEGNEDVVVDCRGHAIIRGIAAEKIDASSISGPAGGGESATQRAVVGSWHAIKEVSLGFADAVSYLPIGGDEQSNEAKECKEGMLRLQDIERAGGFLVTGLIRSVHNGALETLSAGLEGVATALLTSPNMIPSARALPSKWLKSILERLSKGSTSLRWMRRSTGAAACISALLHAEASSVGKGHSPMLHVTLETLIEIASTDSKRSSKDSGSGQEGPEGQKDGSDDRSGSGVHEDKDNEWRATVGALNLLRPLFRQAALEERAITQAERALEAILSHFNSGVWAVRNSALVAFAAIAPRVVAAAGGGKVASQQGRPSPKTVINTVKTFFKRFPVIKDLILRYLKEATSCTRTTKLGGFEADVHPQLFPVLVLLARLSGNGCDATQTLLSQLRQCVSLRFHMMRFIGAKALTALFPQQEMLEKLVLSLPRHHERTSHNTTHGILLQIAALLNISGSHAVQKTLVALGERRWLADWSKMKCAVIRERFISVVDMCLRCASDDAPSWILESALQTLGGKQRNPMQPGNSQVRGAAAGLVYTFLRNKAKLAGKTLGGVTKLGCELLSDPERSVRKTSLQSLVDIFRVGDPMLSTLNLSVLMQTLSAQLLMASTVSGSEEEIRLGLEALSLMLPKFEMGTPLTSDVRVKTRNIALRIAKNPTRHPTATPSALRVAARLLVDDTTEPVDSTEVKARVIWEDLANVIVICSDPSSPGSVREGAAEALRLSGLLWHSLREESGQSRLIVPREACERGWFVAVKLLQDEESSCRDIASKTVAEAFATLNAKKNVNFPVFPCIPSEALRQTFLFIEVFFKGSRTAAKATCQLLCENISEKQRNRLDQQRTKLFPQERANMYQEPVLISRYAVLCLRAIAEDSFKDSWRNEIVRNLQEVCKSACKWIKDRIDQSRQHDAEDVTSNAVAKSQKGIGHLISSDAYEVAYTVGLIQKFLLRRYHSLTKTESNENSNIGAKSLPGIGSGNAFTSGSDGEVLADSSALWDFKLVDEILVTAVSQA